MVSNRNCLVACPTSDQIFGNVQKWLEKEIRLFCIQSRRGSRNHKIVCLFCVIVDEWTKFSRMWNKTKQNNNQNENTNRWWNRNLNVEHKAHSSHRTNAFVVHFYWISANKCNRLAAHSTNCNFSKQFSNDWTNIVLKQSKTSEWSDECDYRKCQKTHAFAVRIPNAILKSEIAAELLKTHFSRRIERTGWFCFCFGLFCFVSNGHEVGCVRVCRCCDDVRVKCFVIEMEFCVVNDACTHSTYKLKHFAATLD